MITVSSSLVARCIYIVLEMRVGKGTRTAQQVFGDLQKGKMWSTTSG
jgi:hypothetical protein